MAASYWAGTGDGTTTDFPVPFAYLDALNVFAKVAGVTASFVWLTSTTIRITPAPASGARVFVFRQSPSTLLVDFTTEGLLTENDLDTAYRHSLYLAEEAVDTAQLALSTDPNDGKFDAQSKVIKNVAAPVSANDAVRLADLQAAQVAAGNVPTPILVDVGKFLKATATGAYSFQQITTADVSGLASGATTTVGTAATKNTGTSGATVPLLNTPCTWSAGLVITGAGLVLGAATGGDKGTGTVNATALYLNGVALSIDQPRVVVQDRKAATTAGAALTVGTYTDRDLNTIIINTVGGTATVSTPNLTLPAGTYDVTAIIAAGSAGGSGSGHAVRTRLFNTTDGVVQAGIGGEDIVSANNVTGLSAAPTVIRGRFTLAAQKNLKFQSWSDMTSPTAGVPQSSTGNTEPEVYLSAEFVKVA